MRRPTYGLSGRQRIVYNYLKRFPGADFYEVANAVGITSFVWFKHLLRKLRRLGLAPAV